MKSPSTSAAGAPGVQRHLAARGLDRIRQGGRGDAAAIADPTRELTAIINRAQALNFAGSPAEAITLTEAALRRTIELRLDDLELFRWFTLPGALRRGRFPQDRGHSERPDRKAARRKRRQAARTPVPPRLLYLT